MAKETEFVDNATDIVADVIQAEGGAERPQGITPAEIEKLENERIAKEEQERLKQEEGGGEKKDEEGSEGDEAKVARLEALEAIEQKIRKNEELTAEEAVLFAQVKDELEEKPETYTFDGKVHTPEETEALVRERYNLGELKISADGMKKLTTDFVAEKNKSAANQRIDQGYKQNAQESRVNTEERMRLANERAALAEQARQLRTQEQRVKKQLEEVKALMSVNITKEDLIDPDTRQIDPDKQFQYHQKLQATADYKRLENELTELQQENETLGQQSLNTTVNAFIVEHSQYKTSEPLMDVAAKMQKGMTVDPEDRMKVIEIFDFINSGKPLEDVYQLNLRRGTLAVKPSAQSGRTASENGQPLINIPKSSELLADKIAKLRERERKSISGLGGGGTQERGRGKPMSAAEKIIEADKKFTPHSTNKQILKGIGW